jgi:glycosyltransferase involved in cell wall biosynthesis
VVERSGGGVVARPGDTQELLRAARSLLEDEALRAGLAKRGRDYAEKTFDIDAIARRFEAVLGRAGGATR